MMVDFMHDDRSLDRVSTGKQQEHRVAGISLWEPLVVGAVQYVFPGHGRELYFVCRRARGRAQAGRIAGHLRVY